MSLLKTDSSVTLDESSGLQNAATSSSVTSDANDNDILAAALPAAFVERLAALGAATPTQAALSGYTGAEGNTGTNVITYSPLGGAADLYFSDASGNALNGTDSQLTTVDGQAIYLYTDTANNNILLGKTSGGEIVFSAYLQETSNGTTGAKIWLVQYEPLFHPDADNPDDSINLSDLVHVTVDQDRSFSLANAPAGQNLFVMFGDSEVAVVVTGRNPADQSSGAGINTGDTVNTSNAAGSTTIGINNQMVNYGEGLYFTFVTGANPNYTVPNLSETEADVEANIAFTGLHEANSASFAVVQLQGDKAATVKITAYTTAVETGVNFVNGLGDTDDVKVNIDSIVVRNMLGEDVTSSVTVQITDGVATMSGILAGYTIEYATDGAHSRLLIENVGTTRGSAAEFDVGSLKLTNAITETAEIGSKIVFEDDGPSIALNAPTDTLALNTQDADTAGTAYDTDSQDFSGAFTIASQSFGTDGASAAGVTWAYGLDVASQGVNSDLTSHGDAIYLYLVSGKVIGSTAASQAGITTENTVFDLMVSSTGTVTLTQYNAVDHASPGADADYASQLRTLGDGKVSLTGSATIQDRDLDTKVDDRAIDLGGNISFNDDGPSITLATPTDTVSLNTQDADTTGTAYDTDSKDFSGAFTIASQAFGADGSGSAGVSWNYALSVASQGMDSDLTSHGDAIYLYLISGKVVGSTSDDEAGVSEANTVFDLVVSSAGTVTLTQYGAIDHAGPGSGSGYASQLKTLGDGKVSLTGTATIEDFDHDTATDAKVLDLGGNIAFNDDGPAITLATPTDNVVLNTHDALTIGEAYDTDSKSFAGAFGIASSSYGGDGAGAASLSWAYELAITSQGMDSGLATNSSTIYLFQLASGVVVGSTAAAIADVNTANTVFDMSVDASGVVTLHQYGQVNHPLPGSDSNYDAQTIALGDGLVSLKATATIQDFDLDFSADYKTLDLGGNVVFSDHGPSAESISNLNGPNVADPIYGTYDFSVGADLVNSDPYTGIVLQSLSGTTANGRAISSTSVTWESEDDTHVNYSFTFQYYSSPESSTLHDASGVVVFNKTDGTFMFDVDAPLVGEATYSTSTPSQSFYYDTMGNKSPEIVVQKYSDNFFGVLTGQASSPPSKTATLVSGDNHVYAAGETFANDATAYMNVATDTVGVNSDTIQAGELLNFDFYTSNPVVESASSTKKMAASVASTAERAYADSVKITLSQLNVGEDIVVLLKLHPTEGGADTTRLLVADRASDYETVGSYKVVTIGTDDYDSANYDIYGIQVLSSTEFVEGTAYRLSDGSAVTLGSAGSGYQDSADLDVFKIIKIDVTTEQQAFYDADLLFSGEVIDHDADYAGFSFGVHLEADGLPPYEVLAQQTAPTPDPLMV